VIFGPTPRDYRKRIPRRVRRLALKSALSDKVRNGKLRVIEKLDFVQYRTKAVVEMLADLDLLDAKVLFILDEKNEKFAKSAANVPIVNVRHAGNASIYEIIAADEVVITEPAVRALEEKFA
jgi:large subunit ribosomal protein L4